MPLYMGDKEVANLTPENRLVPAPTGQPDGKMLATASDALVYVDAPSGGGASFFPLPADGPVGQYRSAPTRISHSAATLGSTLLNSTTTVRLTPMVVLRPTRFDRIGLHISTLNDGPAGSLLLELGWCASDAYGVPDLSTTVSAGTEDITTGSGRLIEMTINVTLSPGLWYLVSACVAVGSISGVNPIFYFDSGVNGHFNYTQMSTNNSGGSYIGSTKVTTASITTSSSAVVLGGSPNQSVPRVGMRVAEYL